MFGMKISRASSTFRMLELRPESLCLFFKKKNFVIAIVPTFVNGFYITSHINFGYDNISSKFNFQVVGI